MFNVKVFLTTSVLANKIILSQHRIFSINCSPTTWVGSCYVHVHSFYQKSGRGLHQMGSGGRGGVVKVWCGRLLGGDDRTSERSTRHEGNQSSQGHFRCFLQRKVCLHSELHTNGNTFLPEENFPTCIGGYVLEFKFLTFFKKNCRLLRQY